MFRYLIIGFGMLALLLFSVGSRVTAAYADEAAPAVQGSAAVEPEASEPQSVGATGEIKVRAEIDGVSQLVLRGDTVRWHHVSWTPPGLWMGHDSPTVINRKKWKPGWIEGDIFALGMEGHDGNYPVLRWNGNDWEYLGFTAVQIARHPDGSLWTVNLRGDIRVYRDDSLKYWEGRARRLAIGAGGELSAIGMEESPGGYEVLRWSGSEWKSEKRGAVGIAVDPDGNPWVVDEKGAIFRHSREGWEPFPGSVHQLAIAPDGTLWALARVHQERGHLVVRWHGEEWETMEYGAVDIAIDADGIPWIVTEQDQVFVLGEEGEECMWWAPVESQVRQLAVGKAKFRMDSTAFKGVSPALPGAPCNVTVDVHEARGKVRVNQQPADENDYTAIVEFDDCEPPGAVFYAVTIRWEEDKTPDVESLDKRSD